MRSLKKFFLTFLLFTAFSLNLSGQPPGGGPGNGNGDPCDGPNPPPKCGKGCWPPPCVPIGTTAGFVLLGVGGLFFAYKKLN